MTMQADSFDLLLERHGQLTRAGEGSLIAAHNFGAVVNVLHDQGYSYQQLADSVGMKTAAGISVYAKLFRKYSTVNLLLRTSRAMGTYDVSRLASDGETVHYVYVYRCSNCGSGDVHRHRASEDTAEDDALVPAQAGPAEAG
jgi:hypothetical protein